MAAVSRHSAYSPVSPRLHTSHSKGFCGARIEIIPSVYQPHQRTSLLPPLAFATFFGELNFGPSFWLFRTLYWRIFKHFFGAKLLFTIISLFLGVCKIDIDEQGHPSWAAIYFVCRVARDQSSAHSVSASVSRTELGLTKRRRRRRSIIIILLSQSLVPSPPCPQHG